MNSHPRFQAKFAEVRRRIHLTYQYHGAGTVLGRAVTFPLRFTPLRRWVDPRARSASERRRMIAWYRRHGRPVAIVIPSYRDAPDLTRLVKTIRRTTPRRRVRIVIADDCSGAEHLAALRRIKGVEIVAGEENVGFAGNLNRGLRAAGTGTDVVILNSDMLAKRGWLATLQHLALDARTGIVGAKLLYPDERIQFAGTIRNPGAPEWFDHRYRFKPANWGPANVTQACLAVTGACMYIKREVLERVGLFDEDYPMAYEDVDYCLRAWQAGYRVMYCPDAELTHLESVTRGSKVGERERTSQRVFWERWGDFFDARQVRTEDGKLHVIYVTQDTGVGGGHRVVFEQANRLLSRGHRVELWSLTGAPDWFDLKVPVTAFRSYRQLTEALRPIDAIKVATWWETADPVWEASVTNGIPVYFVQDIETSYYPDSDSQRQRVLASYRPEFRYVTTSHWNAEHLAELGLATELVSPGIDLKTFRPLPGVARRDDMILALGRSNPLKNLPLTLDAWRALPAPRPELCLFGAEPDAAPGEPGVRYVTEPSDEEVDRLLNEATAFVQTSSHEGFCLPVLEAMAAGCPVACTDAHGNRDYCRDGENCLMPEPTTTSVASALQRMLMDPALRERLSAAGITTANRYGWEERIDALEAFFDQISVARRIAPSTAAVPELRRAPAL